MSIKRVNKTMKDDGEEATIIKSKRMRKLLSSDKQIKTRDDDDDDDTLANSAVIENNVETVVARNTSNSGSSLRKAEKSMDVIIFKYFKDFIHPNKEIRLKASYELIQRLKRENPSNTAPITKFTTDEDAVQKLQGEMLYALKRLIRGCGASTNVSRTGYFTSLVTLLKTFDCRQIPNTEIFNVMQKELHVGSILSNKEDADAVVGQLLVCLALLHSDRLRQPPFDRPCCEQIVQIITQSACHRSYHASLSYKVLRDLLELVSEEQFTEFVWPLLKQDLCRPWHKHTFHSLYALLIIEMKFPMLVNKKFLNGYIATKTLLTAQHYEHFYRVLYQHNNGDLAKHPFLEAYVDYMLNSENFMDFWSNTIDTKLTNASKSGEYITLKLVTLLFNKLDAKRKGCIQPLLSEQFMQMFMGILKPLNNKRNPHSLHNEFLQALVNACRHLTEDTCKVAIIKRLILPPGIISIEKFSNTRVINQLINLLSSAGVQELFDIYKGIFDGTLLKNPGKTEDRWLSNERIKAGYMMQFLLQHKSVANAYSWRSKQLRFLCTVGLFNVNDNLEICRKPSAGDFSQNFSQQCKNIFYNCLLMQQKGSLSQQQELMQELVQFCNQQMSRKHPEKYFRLKLLSDDVQKSWQQMYEVIEKLQQMENQLEFVFRFILLNMGMQLFREPEVAIAAINDLIKCLHKMQEQQQAQSTKKQKEKNVKCVVIPAVKNCLNDENKRNTKVDAAADCEPEWIEVVMELFLHLLSQNNNALRLVVNSVFPHFCSNLNLNAIYQILSLLDMKDGNNPLSAKNDINDEESESTEDNESTKEAINSEKRQLNGEKLNGDEDDTTDDSDENDDDDDDEDDDEDDDDEDDELVEDVTEHDRLRNAISQALLVNGAAAAIDEDCSSIDLNDMTEEEGKRLDTALASAFRAIKSNTKKNKSKSERIQTTTLMHFRIRLLDLLDIYLQQQQQQPQQKQPSFLITIEIMLFVYQMLGYCTAVELVDLKNRIEKFLNNLTNLKFHKMLANHNDDGSDDDELNEDHLVEYIRLIVEKKSAAVSDDLMNRMCNKCIIFLLNNLRRFTKQQAPEKLCKLFCDYVQEFINKRNPNLNNNFLLELFSLRSPKEIILQSAKHLVQCGLTEKTRVIRRIHVYELLTVLYKNIELFKSLKNDEHNNNLKYINKLEKKICQHIQYMAENGKSQRASSAEENSQIQMKNSPKEFQVLIEFILKANQTHQLLELPSKLTQAQTLKAVQNYASKTRLNLKQFYQRFYETFKLQLCDGNHTEKSASDSHHNHCDGSDNALDTEDNDSNNNNNHNQQTLTNIGNAKRKLKANGDARKAKKQAKLERLASVSADLRNNIDFKRLNGCNSNSSIISSSISRN